MQQVCSPYFDPEFESLAERINGPACRVTIDNDSLEDCTVVKIDSVSKQGLLLEVVQVLTDVNLSITKGYISCDAGWFMDVFHVKDDRGKKVTDQRIINYIQQVPLQQVKILDHPDLQDGFGKVWNSNLLTRIIEEEINTHAIDLIITFDNYGVSGHCNHCDVNHGVRKLLRDTSQRNIEAWELV